MDYTYDADVFRRTFESNFTWIGGFMRNVHRFGQRPALIDPISDTCWTYSELNAEVNRLANALASHGVSRGNCVLYQLYNVPQFVFFYIAPQKLCAVNSPINCNLSSGETARLLDRDRPSVYVYDYDVRKMAWEALTIASHRPSCVIAVKAGGGSAELPEGHVLYEDFIREHPSTEPSVPVPPGMYDESTRFCTSGTTGTPKGVPVTQANEVLSAHDCIMHFPLSPYDVTMNLTPWFHRGGLHSGGPTPTLYCGGCVVIMRMFSAGHCFSYVEKYGVTFLIGVPSALSKLADRQEKHPADLSGLRGIVTMGSPLEKEACMRYQRVLTPNIFNGYGTTETFWNSFLRPADLPRFSGSAGRSCTDDEIRVVRVYEDRKAEPEDVVPQDGVTEGEIIISAWAKSAMCYFRNPEQTEEKYYKGWFYTKDIGVWDEGSYITVRGRKDDMIICMGENIYPAQLEEVISGCPGVADCMVTGVPDASRGEAVAAYVIPSDPSLTVKDVHRFCVETPDLSQYKCPRYYRLTDTLPYNATGKKQHVLLKQQALADLSSGALLRP
ncbi:MAG: acyl--CoA ligase [Oscillospiraceae bacterium]|nr:acyl--CoA ligase [Oscillospiraceae bacterium]